MRQVLVYIGAPSPAIKAVVSPKLFAKISQARMDEAYCIVFFEHDPDHDPESEPKPKTGLVALSATLEVLPKVAEAWLMGATLDELEKLMASIARYTNEQTE